MLLDDPGNAWPSSLLSDETLGHHYVGHHYVGQAFYHHVVTTGAVATTGAVGTSLKRLADHVDRLLWRVGPVLDVISAYARLLFTCMACGLLLDYRLALVELVAFAVRARINSKAWPRGVRYGAVIGFYNNGTIADGSLGTVFAFCLQGVLVVLLKVVDMGAAASHRNADTRQRNNEEDRLIAMLARFANPADTLQVINRLVACRPLPLPLCRWDQVLELAAECAAAMGRRILSEALQRIDIDADVVCRKGAKGKPTVFVWTGTLITARPRSPCQMRFPVACAVFEMLPGMTPLGFAQAPDGQIGETRCKCCAQALPRGSKDLMEDLSRTSIGRAFDVPCSRIIVLTILCYCVDALGWLRPMVMMMMKHRAIA